MELSEGLEQYLDEDNSQEPTENAEQSSQLEASSNPNEGEQESSEQGESLESKLDSMEVEGGSNDVLGLVNDLGLIRKGMPFQYDDVEALKSDLMKGYDYTQKTQDLANERKQFEQDIEAKNQEIETMRTEFEEKKNNLGEIQVEYEAMGQVMATLQHDDPELFNELSQKFNQVFSQMNRVDPRFNAVQSELSEVKQMLASQGEQKQAQQHEEIRQNWEGELSDTQGKYGVKLRKLGVRPNWEKVRDTWAKDPEGNMSVSQALFAVHGDEMQKAFEAQAKVAQTKKQSQARRGPDKNDELTVSQHGKGTYLNHLEEIAQRHGI